MILPERVVSNIGYRVLKGLQFIHSRKIIHRDIKPSNLLLNRIGDVKISDFGIARKLEGSHAMSQSYLGTLMYMAPERINTNSYGKPADIWSVGLSLLTCALGKFPFDAKGGYWALTHAIAIEELPSFEHLKEEKNGGFSDDFVDLIELCLHKDPDQRATTMELLEHPLFKKHDCQIQMEQGEPHNHSFDEAENDEGGGDVGDVDDVGVSSSLEMLCQSMSESMLRTTASFDRGNNAIARGGTSGTSASVERISELDQIAEHVVKYYQRERLTGHGVDDNGKVIGPSTPLRDISEMNYREWGNPNEISKLYMKPKRLQRLAKQLGLPYHLVCRKFDKKAADLMGTSVASPSFGSAGTRASRGKPFNEASKEYDSSDQLVVSGVLEASFDSAGSVGSVDVPVHRVDSRNWNNTRRKKKKNSLKAKPKGLKVLTSDGKGR